MARACLYLTKYSCSRRQHAVLLYVVHILTLHPMWLEGNDSSPLGRKTPENRQFQSLSSPNTIPLDV